MEHEENQTIVCEAFDADLHLSGVVALCCSLEWDNFHFDPDLTFKSFTAPGVTTLVAVARNSREVVGFAQVFSDGVGLQAHLSLLAVDEKWRRGGVARMLVKEAFERIGTGRMDLIASDESLDFYRSLAHREQAGFRLYPGKGRTTGGEVETIRQTRGA
ncbi:MAG: GNAT family N-acetyltransferase [Actinomycetota bacterium]|nr:GNAT family N-acetyltransferase [Actinomycetota bacterium]